MTHLEDEIAEINSAIKTLKKTKSKLKTVERQEAKRKRHKHKGMYHER